MAFDWEAFVKHGFAPAAQSVAQWLGADLESKLSRQAHGQRLVEKGYGHGLQMEEIRQRFGQDLYMKELDQEIDQQKDTYVRNQILLRHLLAGEEDRAKAQRRIETTEAEEGIKVKYKKEQYRAMADILGQTRKTQPEKFDEIALNSITKSTESLSKLQDMESKLLERQKSLVSELVGYTASEKAGAAPSPEAQAIRESMQYIQDNQLPMIRKMRTIIEKQMGQFNSAGVTSQGIVPQDKQDLLIRHLGILDDKLHYMGKSLGDMNGEAILMALNESLQDEGLPVQIEPADAQYLLAQIARSAVASFKPKKK